MKSKKIVLSLVLAFALLISNFLPTFQSFAQEDTNENATAVSEPSNNEAATATDEASTPAVSSESSNNPQPASATAVTTDNVRREDIKFTILPRSENSETSTLEETRVFTGEEISLMAYTKVLNDNLTVDNAKMVVSIPKKHIRTKPRISGFNGKQPVDISDDENWKFQIDIGTIRSGSNIGIPFFFSQNNSYEAAEKGFETLIKGEVFTGDVKLTEDTFKVIADRRTVEKIEVSIRNTSNYLGKQNGSVVENSPRISYEIDSIVKEDYTGSALLKKYSVRVDLPPDAQFEESLNKNRGWIYNPEGHYVVKEVNYPKEGYKIFSREREYLDLKYNGKAIPLENVTLKATTTGEFYTQDNAIHGEDSESHSFIIYEEVEGDIDIVTDIRAQRYNGAYLPTYNLRYQLPYKDPAPILKSTSGLLFYDRGFKENKQYTYEAAEYGDWIDTPHYDIKKVRMTRLEATDMQGNSTVNEYVEVLKKAKVYAVNRDGESTLVKTGIVKDEDIILPENTVKVRYVFDEEPLTIKRSTFNWKLEQEYTAREGVDANTLDKQDVVKKSYVIRKGNTEAESRETARSYANFEVESINVSLNSSIYNGTSSYGWDTSFSGDTLDLGVYNKFTSTGRYREGQDYTLRNPKYVVLLPEGFEYIKGSSSELADSINSNNRVKQEPEIIYDYKGTGKTALVYNLPDKVYITENGFQTDHIRYKVNITNVAAEIDHDIKHFFTFVTENPNFYTDTEDELDLNDNGDVSELRTANHNNYVSVTKPRALYLSNQISSEGGTVFNFNNGGLTAGNNAKIKINAENLSDTRYSEAEIVSVLPYKGDKKLDGSDKGSTTSAKLTGAIAKPEGFKVYYSLTDPSTVASPYDAVFVSENEVPDFSLVRSVKFVAENGVYIESSSVRSFVMDVKVDETAKPNDEIYTTAIVKSKEAKTPIEGYRAIGQVAEFKLEGTVFGDREQDGVLSDIDKRMEGYTVMLLNENNEPVLSQGNPITALSDASGKYSITLPSAGNYKVKLVKKDEDLYAKKGYGSNTTGGSAVNNDGISDTFTVDLTNKKATRNLGVTWPTGKVFVRYIDEQGNPLKDYTRVKVGENGELIIPDIPTKPIKENFIGEEYSVVPNVPNYEVVDMQPNSDAVERNEAGDASAVGVVEEGEKTVTFVMRKKTGSITKRIVDTDGNVLKSVVIFPENSELESTITEENKNNAINELSRYITGYPFYMNGKIYYPARELGDFDEYRLTHDGVDITNNRHDYPYYREYGMRDWDGNEVYKYPLTSSGDLVIDYLVMEYSKGKEIMPDLPSDWNNLNYVYYGLSEDGHKEELKIGRVVKDDEGNELETVPLGTKYKHVPPAIYVKDGVVYKFKEVKTGNGLYPLEGIIDSASQEYYIEVHYDVVSMEKPLEVRFVDERGNNLKDPVTVPADGSAEIIKEEKIEKDGKVYSLSRETITDENGKTVITYIYKEKPIEINYVDDKGNVLKNPQTFTNEEDVAAAKVGRITKDNKTYTFTEESNEESPEKITITRVYRENAVEINYVDDKGNVLKEPANFNNSEEAEAGKIGTITKDDKTYTFTEESKQDEDNKTTITRVYRENPVEINYVDDKGNIIKDPARFNNSEEAEAGKISTITKGKNTYTFTEESKQDANGKTTITRVYRENTVEINYVDDKGNILKDPENFKNGEEAEAGKIPTITKDNKVYTFVEENSQDVDGKTTVTRTYKESTIKVNFVDKDGNPIQDSKVVANLEEAIKSKLDKIDKDGNTYIFTKEEANTVIEEGTHIITYYYDVEVKPVKEDKKNKKSPVTGDISNTNELFGLLGVSFIGLIVSLRKKYKNQ